MSKQANMSWNTPELERALDLLAAQAQDADTRPQWPVSSYAALCASGAASWGIPTEYGGLGLAPADLYEAYQRLGGACLTTCFILSQRDAAVRRIRDFGSEALRRELLRPLACGGRFATVGLSQLTTSRQHGQPALAARLSETELVLDGVIPWVTGAAEAHHLVIGAVLEDGKQVLAVLPSDTPGVTVGPPLDLMALAGSMTSEVRCHQARLDPRWLLAGPAERVMGSGRGAGGLETSSLALGLTGAALAFLRQEANQRPGLCLPTERLHRVYENVRHELHDLAAAGGTAEAAARLRARANSLATRATQVALTASKGSGFVRPHPAQRWARQALFFLVWSCPQPAVEALFEEWLPADGCEL